MGGYAYEGPARSHARAYAPPQQREQELSPQEQAQKRRRTAEAVLASIAHTEHAGTRAVAALERAKTAVDIAGFHEAKTKVERAVTRLKELAHELDRLELSADERAELVGEDADKAESLGAELAARVAAIDPPMPWERKLASEAELVAAMPDKAQGGIRRAFDDAEARLAALIGSMSAADRLLFDERRRAAIEHGPRGDQLMERWLRMTPVRRARLRARRSLRPGRAALAPMQQAPASAAVVKHLEAAQIATATGDPDAITAGEYLALWESELCGELAARASSRSYPSPDPALELLGGFGHALGARIESLGLERLRAAIGEPLEDVVDRHRATQEIWESEEVYGEVPLFPGGQAVRHRFAPKPGEGGRVVGPSAWVPAIAEKLSAALDRQIRESLARVAPRAVAADLDEQAIVPGHPFDRVVIAALCAPDTAAAWVDPQKRGARRDGAIELREIAFDWSDDPRLWNWIEVSAPGDARAEDVAATLLGDPARAHEITCAPPLFAIPAAAMSDVAPGRLVLAGMSMLAGAARLDVDAARAPLASDAQLAIVAGTTAAQEAALSGPPGDPGAAARLGATLEVGFEMIGEKLGALGLDPGAIAAPRARLAAAIDRLAVVPDVERAQFAGLFARQAQVLDAAGTLLSAIAPAAGSEPDAVRRELAEQLIAIVAISDLGAPARARLDQLRRDVGALARLPSQVSLDAAAADVALLRELVEGNDPDQVFPSFASEEVKAGAFSLEHLADRHQALSDELSELERAQGTEGYAERLIALTERARALATEVRSMAALAQLQSAVEILRDERGLMAFFVGRDDDLVRHRAALVDLQIQIATRIDHWTLEARLGNEVSATEIRSELAELASPEAEAALKAAMESVRTTRYYKALLSLAALIGIGVASAASGGLAAGAARALGLGARLVAAAEIAGEALFASAATAAMSGQSYGSALVDELVTSLPMFAALRGFERMWKGAATLADSSSAVRRAAATAADFSAQQVVAQAVSIASAELRVRATEGRGLTGDEVRDQLVQGMVIGFGSQVAHRFARPALERIESLGGRAAHALRPRVREIERLADQLSSGAMSTDEAFALMGKLQALQEAEIRLYEQEAPARDSGGANVHGELADRTRASAGETSANYLRLSQAQADRDQLVSMQAVAIAADVGLDLHQGVLIGAPAEVDVLVQRLERLGAVIDARVIESGPGQPGGVELLVTAGDKTLRVRKRPPAGRPGTDVASRAADGDRELAGERAASAARVFEIEKQALMRWASSQPYFDAHTGVIGLEAGGLVHIATRPRRRGETVVAIYHGDGPMVSRPESRKGQPAGRIDAPGYPVGRFGGGEFASGQDLLDARNTGRSDVAVPALELRAVGAEHRGDPPAKDWDMPGRPFRVLLESGQWLYLSKVVGAMGLGKPNTRPLESMASPEDLEVLRDSGRLLTGGGADLAGKLTGKRILFVGDASALWDAELAGPDVAVTVLGRPPQSGDNKAAFDRLEAELAGTTDPDRVVEIEREMGRLAVPATRLPRNRDLADAAANRPNVTVAAGNLERMAPHPDGPVAVTIDGRVEIYDQVVTNFGYDPGAMMRGLLGEGATGDGEVPPGTIALELEEYPVATGADGEPVEAVPFDLVGRVRGGAMQLDGASVNAKVAPWVKKSDRARFLELLERAASKDFVSEHSVGVGPGLEASQRRTERAAEGRGRREYQLPGPGATLHLTDVPEAWQPRIHRFVTEELRLDPERVAIVERSGGKTKDRVFELQVGGQVMGIFKVFRQQKTADIERDVLTGLAVLDFETLAPVKQRETMSVDQGTGEPGGALLMEKADGKTFKDRVKAIEKVAPARRKKAVDRLTADFGRAARALAEMHAATAGGGMMTRAQKESDVRYVVEKLDDQLQAGRISEAEKAALSNAIRNEVAGPFYDAEVPATAYHGDAHVGNLTDGGGGKIGMFDVETMQYSVHLDAEGNIPKDSAGTPQLDGKSTGANDVGRLLESIESMTGGALTANDIKDIHDAVREAYIDAYKGRTGTAIADSDLRRAMKLYRIEAELAALKDGDVSAKDRIWSVINEPVPPEQKDTP